jgi:O-antigen/teichoic acid export membrane protein
MWQKTFLRRQRVMAEGKRQLLSIGVFFIIIVVAILLVPAIGLSWWLVVPVILVLAGLWTLALAAMRSSNPQKYERGAFSTLSLGLLMIAAGGAWYLLALDVSNWLYAVALILLMLGALAIAAASRRK